MNIVLGATYREIISGFTGVAMGHTEYLTGCDQTLLVPKGLTQDGKRPDGEWYDSSRLLLVPEEQRIVLPLQVLSPGCDEKSPVKI